MFCCWVRAGSVWREVVCNGVSDWHSHFTWEPLPGFTLTTVTTTGGPVMICQWRNGAAMCVWRVSKDSAIGIRVQGELQAPPLPACSIKTCAAHICVQNVRLLGVHKYKHCCCCQMINKDLKCLQLAFWQILKNVWHHILEWINPCGPDDRLECIPLSGYSRVWKWQHIPGKTCDSSKPYVGP